MIAHRLLGAGHQTVVAELAPGQTLWCGPHRLLWATPNVTVRLRPPAPGPDGVDGVLDRAVATAVAAGRRRLAGAPAGLPHLRAVGGSGLAALAGPDGGEVRAVELAGRGRVGPLGRVGAPR